MAKAMPPVHDARTARAMKDASRPKPPRPETGLFIWPKLYTRSGISARCRRGIWRISLGLCPAAVRGGRLLAQHRGAPARQRGVHQQIRQLMHDLPDDLRASSGQAERDARGPGLLCVPFGADEVVLEDVDLEVVDDEFVRQIEVP